MAIRAREQYKKGRLSKQGVHVLIGYSFTTAMFVNLTITAFFLLPRYFINTDSGSGWFAFYAGLTLFGTWYPAHRYRRYLKRTDVCDLPFWDAQYRSYNLWVTRHDWMWPLAPALMIGGLYVFFKYL